MKPLLYLVLSGCLFGSKAAPLDIRYFSPEADHEHRARPELSRAAVRIGRITASAHLRYRIVHRTSEAERTLFDSLRWTEQPDEYVRRSLVRALFEDGPLEHAVGGTAPTLDVEVLAFEYAERAGRHAGRVQLRYELYDDKRVLADGIVTEERAAAGSDIELVVPAIGAAMDAATATVGERVSRRLCP